MSERTTIGCYRVLRLLGQGGMGEVYLAEDPRLGRQVAVKVLGDRALKSEESRRRFEREAKTAAQLAHPNIVHIYEVGEAEGVAYIVMEHVEGRTLRELIQQELLGTQRTLQLAEGIADGLAAAHERGIIHRDIKPANILVDPDGRPRILDFGLAKALDVSTGDGEAPEDDRSTISQITQARKVMGTVAYMSPEQAAGKSLDHRSDIFSFGVVLYQMVSGHLPFEGDSDITTLVAILRDTPASLAAWSDTVPPELEQVIFRCLEKRPEDRYQTTRDMLEDVRALARGGLEQRAGGTRPTPWRGTSPARTATGPGRVRDRRWGLASGLAAMAVAGMGVFLMTDLQVWQPVSSPGVMVPGMPMAPLPPELGLEMRHAFPVEVRVGEPAREPGMGRERGRHGRQSAEKPHGRVLAILGFRNHTGDAGLDWISSGLPEILITDLGDLKGIRLVGTRKLSDLAARAGASWEKGLPPKIGWRIAQEAGAELLLTGSLFKSSEGLRLDVGLEDMSDGTVVYSEKQVGDDVFELAGRLTESLRAKLGGSVPEAQSEPRERLTSSEPAMAAFARAMTEFNRVETGQAIPHLEEALRIDPDFLLARLRLVQCYRQEGLRAQAQEQLQVLKKHKERLSRKHAELIELYDADQQMSVERTLRAAEELEAYAEDDPEIAMTVCKIQTKVGKLTGDEEQVAEGLNCLRQIYEKDPLFAPAVQTYAVALHVAGQQPEALARLADYAKARPDDGRMRTLYAQALQDANRLDSAAEELRQVVEKRPGDSFALRSLADLARRLENFEDAEHWLSRLLDGKGTPARIQAAMQETALQVARGHIEAAQEVVRRGSELAKESGDPLAAFELRTKMAEVLLAVGRAEEAWKLGEKAVAEMPGKGSIKALEAAMYAHAAGQEERAGQLAAQTFAALGGEADQLLPVFAQLIELAEATAGGDLDEAVDLAEEVRHSEPQYLYFPLVRLALAEGKTLWLRDYLKAALAKTPDPSDPHRIYAHYWLGRAEEAEGRKPEARSAYRELLHWWSDGDRSIAEIAEAKERLAALEKECPGGAAAKCPELQAARKPA